MAKEEKGTQAPVVKAAKEPKTKASREIKVKEDKSFFRRISSNIQRFMNETVGELRKVNWPTRKEATNLTLVVLVVTFGMAIFLGLMDLVFSNLIRLILG